MPDFKSELPENTRITVQYEEDDGSFTETKTYELFVIKDRVDAVWPYEFSTEYGYHETIVDPNLTTGIVFVLTYKIHRNGEIREIRSAYKTQNQPGIPARYLGYENGETITGLKIIAIDTPRGESINLRANHTGFQPQKIW